MVYEICCEGKHAKLSFSRRKENQVFTDLEIACRSLWLLMEATSLGESNWFWYYEKSTIKWLFCVFKKQKAIEWKMSNTFKNFVVKKLDENFLAWIFGRTWNTPLNTYKHYMQQNRKAKFFKGRIRKDWLGQSS